MDDGRNGAGRKAVEPEIVNPEREGRDGWQSRFQNQAYSGVWTIPAADRSGCLGPAITFALFLICLAQFGVLAGIGFLVFYTIGAILGSIHSARLLMAGRPAMPWAWRAGNWTISFLLTVWLAGGFAS